MPRFPFVRQKDSMQCGAACLSSICRHYGKPYSTRFISRFCQETATGVSLRALSMAAEHLGFDTMCVKIQKSAINDCNLPCILHWNQNHFVVLHKTDSARHKYYISYPGKGLICADDKEFDEAWLSASGIGIALLLEPNGRFGKLGGEESADSHSLTFIFRYMKEYRGYLVQIFLGLLFGCLLQLILPFLTQSIVDIGIGRRDIGFIWLILLGEFMIVFGKTATDFIRRIANIWSYIQSLPLKFDTKIGQEGTGLSQGQKQRILIARAVYKNPEYIFLDEATNALDAENERVIVENLNKFYNGRTVVVVAHRLSTVKNSDQIIVLDEGRVSEMGDHKTLIANKGAYYNLIKNQLELGN